MRTLFLLPFLLMPAPLAQSGPAAGGGPALSVLSHSWTKSRRVVEKHDTQGPMPAPAVVATNKVAERNRRVNDPVGARDPNADTTDGRAAALERINREARSPKTKEIDGYAYRVKVRNEGGKAVEVLFWEYQFEEAANPSNVARRQFLCGVDIKAGREKELQAFGALGPGSAISVASLANGAVDQYRERVVINRVEYADGSIWQRPDWKFAEVRASVARAVATPWSGEMCRGL